VYTWWVFTKFGLVKRKFLSELAFPYSGLRFSLAFVLLEDYGQIWTTALFVQQQLWQHTAFGHAFDRPIVPDLAVFFLKRSVIEKPFTAERF
jgi:hypothetical protein